MSLPSIPCHGVVIEVEEDFVAGQGCIAFEMANSNHTLKVMDDSEEELILLTVIEGSLISYDNDGNTLGSHDS